MKAFLLALVLALGTALSAQEFNDGHDWFVFNGKTGECVPARAGNTRLSPAHALNGFNCEVRAWDWKQGWVILHCNDVKIQGLLFFSLDKITCDAIRESLLF